MAKRSVKRGSESHAVPAPPKAPAPEGFAWAYGDSGYELTPVDDVTYIPMLPVGSDGCVIPATCAFLASEPGDLPAAVLEIEPAGITSQYTGEPTRWPRVAYRRRSGEVGTCYVRNDADARHAFWATLPAPDRLRLRTAVDARA